MLNRHPRSRKIRRRSIPKTWIRPSNRKTTFLCTPMAVGSKTRRYRRNIRAGAVLIRSSSITLTPCTRSRKKPRVVTSTQRPLLTCRQSATIMPGAWTRKRSMPRASSRAHTRRTPRSAKKLHKMTQKDFQALTPDWNWADYFKGINLVEPGDINVQQPEFFKAANAAFTATPIDDWKTYLRWHLINAAAADLSNDFVNEDFNFKDGVLRGTKQIKPRWKRVVISTDEAIGEALGKLYVADYFPPEAKARALELVNNLKAAL